MRLYATVTSERASKGQGGNKQINVQFTIEHDNKEREDMGDVFLCREGNDYLLTYCADGGEVTEVDRLPIKAKGKQQKGEKPEHAEDCPAKRGQPCAEWCMAE